jgi:hypothetical protein
MQLTIHIIHCAVVYSRLQRAGVQGLVSVRLAEHSTDVQTRLRFSLLTLFTFSISHFDQGPYVP